MIADRVAAQMIRGDVKNGMRIVDKFFAVWLPFDREVIRPWRRGQLDLPPALADDLAAIAERPARAMKFRLMTHIERRAAGIRSRLVVVEPTPEFLTLRDRIKALNAPAPATAPEDPHRGGRIRRALRLTRGRA